jgi:RNA polymerase sigma-70 factor (ECF subfamily)
MFPFGPANAIRKQYAQLQPKLYRLAWSWCQNSEDAQDLVQEAWIKALERSNQLRDQEKLLQWMSRIMVNLYRDNQRRRHNDTTLDQLDLPSQDITGDTIHRHEAIQRVQQAVAQLPLDQRMVLTLVDLMESAQRISQMVTAYPTLTFVACRNTIQRLKVEKGIEVLLLPEATTTESGVAHVVRRQNEGWIYIQV